MHRLYADVIVDITSEALDRVFSYIVPEELGDVLRVGTVVEVPFGKGSRVIRGFVTGFRDTPQCDPEKLKKILRTVTDDLQPETRLVALAGWMRERYGGTMAQALRTVLPVKKKIRPKEKKQLRLAVGEEEARQQLEIMHRKHYAARERLLRALLEEGPLPQDLVLEKLNIQTSVIRALETQGLISIHGEISYRTPAHTGGSGEEKRPVLTQEQRHAVETIKGAWENDAGNGRYLIHGVTGSGKTVVYLELIEEAVRRGEQAIVLIPEIALTYQTMMRFYRRFGERVSFINSRLSPGERYDQYERAKKGLVDVMIGPRSALFTPFPNLGIIVIDEEHERSYSSETVPRYHAREVAFERAQIEGARVVLGSATPSLEAYHDAMTGKITLLTMDSRVGDSKLPHVQIVDMRRELKSGNRSIFSRALAEEIASCSERGEQSMLFLNRRGFAGFVSCRSCGHVITCPHCDVSLSLHRRKGQTEGGRMVCHYCGYEEEVKTLCPECGSPFLRTFRAGTQQVEEELSHLFPQLKILRMDADTTRSKESHAKILSAFADHEADVLIGTQMIVKGHDFPDVTLMGILAADLSLHVPEYRAAERTFQLLTQAAGRAGRAQLPGKVIVQTYDPDHYSIRCAAAQDYVRFYEQEMDFRSMAMYPPAGHLVTLHISGPDEEKLAAACTYLQRFALRLSKDRQVRVLGPADEPISKVQDIYRKTLYLKGMDQEMLRILRDKLQQYIQINEGFRGLSIQYETE